MPKIDDSLKAEVVKWSAFYEHRIRTGSVGGYCSGMKLVLTTQQKVIFHLEAFVAKFMRLYEANLMGMDLDMDLDV